MPKCWRLLGTVLAALLISAAFPFVLHSDIWGHIGGGMYLLGFIVMLAANHLGVADGTR